MNEIEIYKYYAPSIRCYTGQQSYNHTNTSLSDGTKVVRCSEQYNLFYPDERAPNENIVDLITGFAATKQPPYFITVYDEPSDIMEYIHECNDELGSEFVIVGVEDFINLQYLPSQNWILLTYDDFEDGFGNFVDAGSDCILYTGESRAFQGNNAVNLQNNTSSSLIYLANPLDLESYTKLKVEFFFYTYGLENNEGFFVEYFNGDNWIQVAHFKAGTDFDNGQFLFKSFILTNREVNFSNNSNLRFRNNTDSSYDDVYLDKVEISALQ
jgi:hypothetical protein